MELQETRIKPSFFDEDNIDNYKIWRKESTLKKPSDIKVMEGNLFKKSSRTNFWKSRFYVLFEDRLAYFKNGRDGKEQAYCFIQNMRMETFSNEKEKDEKYGIRFSQNGRYYDLYARAKDQYDTWVAAFRKFCVLTSYESNFINTKVIGKGSFAKVYLAKRKEDNLDLAVKTFDKSLLLKQEKARASLINEINIMRRLSHDNIIKLYDVYENENHVYLVTELLHGGELFDRIIKKGQYTERDACTLMKKLLSALEYMHSRGIMHRDIKPENLILKDVENDWNIKIADFGLATFVNPNNEYLFKRCGTPGYVAPEVLDDQKYDQKVDVFSCGVILYILLTGGSPFYGKSYNEILWKNKVCEITFNFKDLGYKVSEPAIDLLKKMLEKDPTQRISSYQALNHEWIIGGGSGFALSSSTPAYLCSAQENMKKFQEENRFNVKRIKPKDLNKNSLEKSGHAPSPLLNGNIRTMASYSPDQKRTSLDPRRTSLMPNQKSKFADGFSVSDSGFGDRSFEAADDDGDDLDADEHSMILHDMTKYRNGFTLLSQVKDNNSSNNSSLQNTPQMTAKINDPDSKKAMIVQEHLLGYLGNGKQEVDSIIDPEQKRKTDSVKQSLRHMQ